MSSVKQIVWAFICALFLTSIAAGQETENNDVSQTAASKKIVSPKATIKDASWITGNWEGEAMGGKFQESWSRPMGNSMMGVFKFVEKDQIGFYEILTIVESEGSLVLRLKHFNSKLVGWEEKDKSIEFPLKSISKFKLAFDGLVFEKVAKDRLKIVVQTKSGDETGELVFNCKRHLPKVD